ncbi:MAG: Stage II sporulation protein related to metaloproteases (SpoIIQ) [Brockia lithotrophica]|uniref:Stage II sporulation protein related to metaloproteases (SpoIIQ) n=1 Tax=Brockia lithotrophica TaxID=933949 RepID=A0A2T5GAV7_9BACL|nr:M23 family metallopeptidase [Brockia lithotrophica]PTQ53315.1 MAG: Stage II sporulation protein related to metaloproteases (SpoIIQ) [Brockia lithotrophica]
MDKEHARETQEVGQGSSASRAAGGEGREDRVFARIARTFRSLPAQKWFFPAVYLGAAALLLSLVFWTGKQAFVPQSAESPQPVHETQGLSSDEPPAVPTTEEAGAYAWPVSADEDIVVVRPYYDDEHLSDADRAKALVSFAGSYYPNRGIDLARKDGKPFAVLAAAPGKVVRAERDPLVGYVVWIAHEDGRTTVYESLAEVKVKAGDAVERGTAIGTAGTAAFDKDAGVHLHFEVRKGDRPENPAVLLPPLPRS